MNAVRYQVADTTLADQELVIPGDRKVYLGHNAIFSNCTIMFRCKKKGIVTLAKARFDTCSLIAEMPLIGVQWVTCDVSGCSFRGHFEDNVFGNWPEYTSNLKMKGSLESCDFSQAILHQCEFHDCRMQDLKLPGWPCFTLVSPKAFFDRLSTRVDVKWIKYWNSIDGEMARMADPSAVAMAYHAPSLVKRLSLDVPVTDKDIFAALQGMEHVRM